MRISVICVYNNSEQLNECLIKSLQKQNTEYELILVDGSNGKFKSCAAALNYGASKCTGEVLVFTHQDIILKQEKDLKDFAEFILDNSTGTVVGVAGAIEKKKKNIGNYTSGVFFDDNLINEVTNPIQVACIDECFFGMSRSTYAMHIFDETLCDNWHLYAVEQCLYHRMTGGKVYVFPCQIHHLSKGKINLKYMDGLVMLSKHYHSNFLYIWTTCYKIRCSVLGCLVLRNIWLLNRKIRRKGY